MCHVLDLTGSALGLIVQQKLRTLKIWDDPFQMVQADLISGLGLCDYWIKTYSELISLWKGNCEDRAWSSVYNNVYILSLGQRLQKILLLRATCNEFSLLLEYGGESNRNIAKDGLYAGESLSSYFAGIDPLLCSRHADPMWSLFPHLNMTKCPLLVLCFGSEIF